MIEMFRSAVRAPRNWLRRRRNAITHLHDLTDVRTHLMGESLTVQTPEAASMLMAPGAAALRSESYSSPVPSVATVSNVLFSGKYQILLTDSGSVIPESVSSECRLESFDPRTLRRGRRQQLEGTCTTIRSHRNGFYHTLIDNLPRLCSFTLPQAAPFHLSEFCIRRR